MTREDTDSQLGRGAGQTAGQTMIAFQISAGWGAEVCLCKELHILHEQMCVCVCARICVWMVVKIKNQRFSYTET